MTELPQSCARSMNGSSGIGMFSYSNGSPSVSCSEHRGYAEAQKFLLVVSKVILDLFQVWNQDIESSKSILHSDHPLRIQKSPEFRVMIAGIDASYGKEFDMIAQ